MARAKKSEEITKGLTVDKLSRIEGYPSCQNVSVNGITWFKEDSYIGTNYDWLDGIFAKASKKQTLKSKGTPDFMVVKEQSNVVVVIECKSTTDAHMNLPKPDDYRMQGYGSAEETEGYAVNGALWYASFLCDNYDVVAVAVSGQSFQECRVTSFVWPKKGNMIDIRVLEDKDLDGALCSIEQYEKDIEIVLDRYAKTEEAVRKTLRKYTLSCANFLRQNGIEDNSKAGFISAIVLGLTNTESKLYIDTQNAIEKKYSSKSKKMISDPIGRNAVQLLKDSLYGAGNIYESDYIKGIWDIDDIPYGKRTALIKFYDGVLSKDELRQAPKGKNKLFSDGNTVLSCCIYSLYENVIAIIENYHGIDVMGEFYTTFLRFTKGNAKEKGIVLTPKHITELFCDIAEFYSDRKFDENTKIIDICCGTGAFLISALARIKRNINATYISEEEKNKKYIKARENSLIGVERDASMYALAYANMRFHGDGKSNLFNCSSLLIDSYAPVDDSGKTFLEDKKIPLHEALGEFDKIDIGMINPPYSLDKKDTSSTQEYLIVKKINEYKDKNKKLKRKLRELKKLVNADLKTEEQIQIVQNEIKSNSSCPFCIATSRKPLFVNSVSSACISALDGDVKDIPDYFLEEGYEKACWYMDHIDQNEFERNYAGRINDEKIDLSGRKWTEFHLYDLFEIDYGNKFDKSKMSSFIPTVRFVGRSSQNNGVTAYVDEIDEVYPYEAGLMTVALGGEYLGSCFVQEYPFYTSQNVAVLRPISEMSIYTKLFIAHLIRFESKNNYKAFARELNAHIKTDFVIKLPINSKKEPDFSFIDNYIKSLSFSRRLEIG